MNLLRRTTGAGAYGEMQIHRSKYFHIGLLGLLFLSLCLSFPKHRISPEMEKWKKVSLPFTLLESRLRSCEKNSAHRKACNEAQQYLEAQLRLHSNKGDNINQSYLEHAGKTKLQFPELFRLLREQNRPESEWVAGALNAWLSALDPHAQIALAESADEQVESKFIPVRGVGVKLRFFRGRTLVAYVMEGSGAEISGLRAGDEILKLEEVDVKSLSTRAEKEQAFREAKPPMKLLIRRGNKHLDFVVNERRLELANVEWRKIEWRKPELSPISPSAALKVRSFQKDSTCDDIRAALIEIEKSGVKSLELDLRNNPGGLVREAQCVAGLFLGAGKLFARMERSTKDKILPASPAGYSHANDKEFTLFTDQDQLSKMPLIVHINQNTASAAEMLAAALQDEGRAKIIGARSYGKGSMQSIFHPWNDERLYFTRTTHRIIRPSGKGLNLSGVIPDIVTERAEGMDFPREAELTQ